MKLLDMYSILFANWLNGGSYSRAGRLKASSIEVQYNFIFTKTHVKQIFKVNGIKPDNFDIDFISYLRDRMFELHPDVEMDINIDIHPVRVDVSSDKFTRAFSKADTAFSNYKEAFDSQKGIARLTGKVYRGPNGMRVKISRDRLDSLWQARESYRYLHEYLSQGGTSALVDIFIELSAPDLRAVKRAAGDLYGLLGSVYAGGDVVRSANKAYYWEMGPAVPSPKTLSKKFLPQLLFTDENIAAFTPYKSRGLVGGGKGALLLGMDFRSRLPLSIDIWHSGSAQVYLLMGQTGSGKTYAAFNIALSALALGDCCVTALDVKGREWIAIADFVQDCKVITFDDRNPSFVNTLRLDDVRVTPENAMELFNMALNGTVKLFMLVLNLQESEGNWADAELVIREAVMKVYSTHGVDPANPITFGYTRGLRYADVLPILDSLLSTSSYTEEQRHIARLAYTRLNSYFGEAGIFADAFRNEISLGDVLYSSLVIYELNKNQGAVTDSKDSLRVFMIQYLDSKKKAMLKEQGKYLFAFYEELQRCEAFADLLTYVCGEATGARSNNAVIFLVMNSLKVLQSKAGQDLRSSITSIICGKVEDNDIQSLEQDFGKVWLSNQLRMFANRPQVFRHCMACDIDTGTENLQTVYRVEIPDSMSRKFRTRTIKDD